MKRNITYKKFGSDKTVFAKVILVHLLLPCREANAHDKSKELKPYSKKNRILSPLFAMLIPLRQIRKTQTFGVFIFVFLTITAFSQNNSIHSHNSTDSYKEYQDLKTELNNVPTKKVNKSKFRFVAYDSVDYKLNGINYKNAFNELSAMLLNDTSINVKRAVYIVENAKLKNKITYSQYLKLIQSKVNLVNSIIKKEKLDPTNSDAIHYSIQKLYSDTIYQKQSNGTIKKIKPLHYDFNDPFGEKNQTNQMVSKLLMTGKGQCHSMPLLYMILAEEFKVKSYLSYSPQHSFIKFQTKNGTWYNFETTNGRLTTDAFVLGSGFIKSEALKSNIFNTPHNPKQVIANMFIDLANDYQERFGYDDFQQQCVNQNFKYNSNYIYAKIVQSNYQTALTDLALAQENYPAPQNIPYYPNINEQFQKRNALYDELDNVGYTTMPKEAYQVWLQTLKQGQEKQNSEDLNLKFIHQLKK